MPGRGQDNLKIQEIRAQIKLDQNINSLETILQNFAALAQHSPLTAIYFFTINLYLTLLQIAMLCTHCINKGNNFLPLVL